MGGVTKKISKIFGGGGATVKISAPEVPDTPDYEAERKAAEEEALRNRSRLKALGMGGTILGGTLGDDSGLRRKKLLGE